MFGVNRDLDMIRYYWPKGSDKKRNFKQIKQLYSATLKDKDKIIDDQTWGDLDMDTVYSEMDKANSTPGQQALYNMLRRPLYSQKELDERKKILEELKNNPKLREKLQLPLFKLGYQKRGETLDLLQEDLKGNKWLVILYNILGLIPIVTLISMFFIGIKGVIPFILIGYIYSYIHYKVNKKILLNASAISYLALIIKTAKSMSKIEFPGLQNKIDRLSVLLEKTKKISKYAVVLNRVEGLDSIGDYAFMLLFIQEKAYYKTADTIANNREDLLELYKLVGEIDALISVAAYMECIEEYCIPEFVDGNTYIKIEEGRHPLVENCVTNSLELTNEGVLLTGTNMAGKSTFLRTIGINSLLAQTFNFALAKSFKGNFFRIITSISPQDDVTKGKSYYMGEAEAMLRIVNSIKTEPKILCIIDEIFRGTNPVERIAASEEILKYIISENNTIALVATHDHELTKLSSEGYKCYYFSENVDEKAGLTFDYKLKKGVSPSTNAIKLLRFMGYPEIIINNAFEKVRNNLKK
jgi:DNA mismatch repair ATPase MutS